MTTAVLIGSPAAAGTAATRTLPLRTRARRAGLLYAAGGVAAPFALLYVPRALFVRGDAAATAERIGASAGLVRMGIAAELLHCTLLVVAVLALYRLFREVSQPLATLMAALILIAVPIQVANLGNYAAALTLTSEASWLGALTKQQLDALVYLFVRLHAAGLQVAQVFWGAWLFPYGLVAMRSGFIPRWIGAALLAAGVGCVVASATALFFPAYWATVQPVTTLLMAGELPMIVWLIGWGARAQGGVARRRVGRSGVRGAAGGGRAPLQRGGARRASRAHDGPHARRRPPADACDEERECADAVAHGGRAERATHPRRVVRRRRPAVRHDHRECESTQSCRR